MIAATSSSWRTTKVKFVSDVISGGTPQSANPDYWDGPVPWLTPVDLGKEGSDAISGSSRTITHDGVSAAGLDILPPGSIVISTRAPIGSVGLLVCEATTNQGCKAIVPSVRKLDSKFAYYFAFDVAEELQSLGLGTTFLELSTYSLKNLKLTLPASAEQRRVVAYLDEQTAKIDRLMEMRRRQMALLKEQRAALIQQAVTRGLNPNAPMKDSGLPWLGEIPAHWEVMRLGSISTIKARLGWKGLKAEEYVEEGYIFLATPNIKGDEIDFENVNYITKARYDESPEIMLRVGDVLLAKDGATLGITALVKNLPAPATVNGSIAVIRPCEECTGAFLALWFSSHGIQQHIDMMKGGMGVPHLFQSDLRRFPVVMPQKEEQVQISTFVENETKKVNNLISAYARQLTLLAEYRVALIHECVTGQRAVTQRTVVEARPTKANIHFLRAVLCSEIVHRLHQEPTFGRVKLEKFLYLSEAYAGIDLEGRYRRAAAGPFDNRALRSAENQIQRQKWYRPVKGEKGTRYVPMEKAGGHRKYFSRYWPEQQPKFDRLVDLLRSFDTERCEIVATLFAVWKDRLRADQPCTDADIVEEVLTQWHPSKQRIPRERWLNALEWMKQEGLTP